MSSKFALAFSVILAISVSGCSKSPKGFYVSQNLGTLCVLELKSHGRVLIRDLSEESPSVAETTFVVENGIVRIHEFKVGGTTSAWEFSMVKDTLVTAKGIKFNKDTSSKTYSPAERLAERKAEEEKEEAEERKQAEQQAEQERKQEEQRLLAQKAREVEDLKLKEQADKQHAERERIAALQKQAEQERAKAIEDAKIAKENAKRYAAEHLPTFTNQIATLMSNDGRIYSNICLKRASLDGIVYTFTNALGGGLIPNPKLDPDTLESLNIDTNMIAVGEDRALVKAELDRQYNLMVAQVGATKADEYRRDMNQRLNSYAGQQAFAMQYGIARPTGRLRR
ncbi:MAG: hypothetical protein ACLQU3_07785 [Limisphaerales bacterium]